MVAPPTTAITRIGALAVPGHIASPAIVLLTAVLLAALPLVASLVSSLLLVPGVRLRGVLPLRERGKAQTHGGGDQRSL